MLVDQAVVGMQLANNICAPNGRVLIKAGQCINERHIKALKAWGISVIEVLSDTAGPAQGNSTYLLNLSRQLDSHFSMSNRNHPAVEALYRLCLAHAAAKHQTDARLA